MSNSYFQFLLKEHNYNLISVMQNYFSSEDKLAYNFKKMVEGNNFDDANDLLSKNYINIEKSFNNKGLAQIFVNAIDQHFTYTSTHTYVAIWKKLLDMKISHFTPRDNLLNKVLKMKAPIKIDLIKEIFKHNFDIKKLRTNPTYDFCTYLSDDISEESKNVIAYLSEWGFSINERIPQRRGLLNIEYTCLDLAIRKNNKNLALILLNLDAESNFVGEPYITEERLTAAYGTKNETFYYVAEYMGNVGKIINMQNYIKEHSSTLKA